MKNYKRAKRRHDKKKILLKRIDNWLIGSKNKREEKRAAIDGKCLLFLRTTGNPCNCYGCSGSNKYKRKQKALMLKSFLIDL